MPSNPRTRARLVLNGRRCQCPTCKEYFSTITNFEKHRVGDYATGKVCVDPESVGMAIATAGSSTYWITPSKDGKFYDSE